VVQLHDAEPLGDCILHAVLHGPVILGRVVHVQGLRLARRRAPAPNPVQACVKGRVQEGHHVTVSVLLHCAPDGANHVADHQPFIEYDARSGALHEAGEEVCNLANGADGVTAAAGCLVTAEDVQGATE